MRDKMRRFFVWVHQRRDRPFGWYAIVAVPAVLGMLGVVVSVLGFVHTLSTSHNPTFGSCQLESPTPVKVERLQLYTQQGLANVKARDLTSATAEFRRVIDIDPHYLGAHQNLGVVQMDLGRAQDAIRFFHQETTVINCLKSVPYEQLWNFAYFLKKVNMTNDEKNVAMKERLDKAEDTVNYNLACALAKEGETQNALDELKKASANQSISRSVVDTDRELDSVRKAPGFQSALNQFPQ